MTNGRVPGRLFAQNASRIVGEGVFVHPREHALVLAKPLQISDSLAITPLSPHAHAGPAHSNGATLDTLRRQTGLWRKRRCCG